MSAWRVPLIAGLLLLAALTPFQNCSLGGHGQGNGNGDIIDASTSPQGLNGSGGEGYGGKVFRVVSPADPCADPSLPISEIHSDQTGRSFLTAKNCSTLITPEPVTPLFFASDPSLLNFNGQTFRDVNSSAPFTPMTVPVFTWECENMPAGSHTPTGGGVDGDWYVLDDQSAGNYVGRVAAFPVSGIYRFSLRARGIAALGSGAGVSIEVDGSLVGESETANVGAEYSFEMPVTAGNHDVRLRLTNDGTPGTAADRDLYLDRLIITRY